MTQTEALKLALESMKRIDAWLIQRGYTGLMPQEKEVITSIEAALAQPEQKPVAYLCENAIGHKYFRWKKPSSTYKPIALYTTPPQLEERNFCPRCGKRTADLTVIHTCTPPQPEQEPVAWQDTADKCRLETVPAKGGLLPQRTDEEEYLSKAYRLADELRCHLAIAPAPQRTWGKPWVSLTDEEIQKMRHLIDWTAGWSYNTFARAIEAKLKEKNT